MRKISIICLLAFLLMPISGHAQRDFTPVHGDCLSGGTDEAIAGRRAGRMKLPTVNDKWDSEKVYRQMVILIEFADTAFSCTDDPQTFYDKALNESGFNKRNGPGCMADYFRDQSEGLLNLKFDVYGPIKVSSVANPYSEPNANTRNYGKESFKEALEKVIAVNPEVNYSVYDWNGDGTIEQVVYIYAGLPGNLGAATYGYVWPNTGSISTVTAPGGYKISNYTASGELWPVSKPTSCGIGTICHEFTHSLGLPDIYPTVSSAGYSVCDEWDLMDGGNFTNYGWCPPNFTPMEKWLLGWVSFTDLEEPASIRDLKPAAEGGEIYRIKHSESEWLLLENRQQSGWDAGVPGKGLVIYHVNYDGSMWRGNTVNNSSKRRFELVHADNMDYDAWKALVTKSPYTQSPRMNSCILSTSPYPWVKDSIGVVNDSLTETSVPAPIMNFRNEKGDSLLNKPITNIRMSEDGLISFDFMGGDPIVISGVYHPNANTHPSAFDLFGRRISASRSRGVIIQRQADGTVRKYFK